MPLQTLEKKHIHNTMMERQQYPFFSSTLLEKIYSSMDEGCEVKLKDTTFHRKNIYRKETTANRHPQAEADQKRKTSHKPSMQRRHFYMSDRKRNEFASSCSTSSESSAAGFSSSGGESVSASKKFAPSCFAPFGLKPVRTNGAAKQSKGNRELKGDNLFDELPHRVEEGGSGLFRSKAMKIYDHLKKPISPGGRLSSLISSLFTSSTNNTATRNQPTCKSSSSSFARSCLSKNSPSTRDKMKNNDKRTVRFYPMIVTFDSDSKPCSRKWLYEEEGPILVTKEWSQSHHPNRMGSEVKKGSHTHCCGDDYRTPEEEEDDDDDASCTSSDLFELDHLFGIKSCKSELPVFESTRIGV